MNIYLAARYSRRLELCKYRKQLESMGYVVTSRWLNGNHQAENDQLHSGCEAERFAEEDLVDVLQANLMIAFTEQPRSTSSRGGRHVEFGVAIGREMPVWVIGPRENVFHCLKEVRQFDSWADAAKELQDVPKLQA